VLDHVVKVVLRGRIGQQIAPGSTGRRAANVLFKPSRSPVEREQVHDLFTRKLRRRNEFSERRFASVGLRQLAMCAFYASERTHRPVRECRRPRDLRNELLHRLANPPAGVRPERHPAFRVETSHRAQQANDRGLQLYREKQYDEAAAQFAEALKLRPDFAQAANNLGFVYYRQQRYAEAARWLENTLKIDPSRAVAHLNLGDAYFNAGDKAKAKQAYTTYLALQPQGSGAAQARAQLEKL